MRGVDKKKIIIAIAIFTLVALATTYMLYKGHDDTGQNDKANGRSLIDGQLLASLDKRSASGIDFQHLGDGLAAPTNRWFSGLALQAEPKPVFAYPNSYLALDDGIEIGVPVTQVQPSVISGGHQAGMIIRIAGSKYYKVTRYDELTVDLAYFNSKDQKLATVTIGAGLPYVYLQSDKTTSSIDVEFDGDVRLDNDGRSATSDANARYFGVSLAEDEVSRSSNGVSFDIGSGLGASFYAASNQDLIDTLQANASARVKSGKVSYSANSDKVKTRLIYETTNNSPVVIATLPHHNITPSEVIGSQDSIYGELKFIKSDAIEYQTDKLPLLSELDLSGLSRADKSELTDQLVRDVAATEIDAPDTYFGGKQLQRASQLLVLADQLDQSEQANIMKTKLNRAFDDWFGDGAGDTSRFYYDEQVQGLVGLEASFGSEEFNDHHFHYGHMIYAAAVLSKYDETFTDRHGNFIDLLVADIANYADDEPLPLRRNFDPYFGHSWASGSSPFADGNNQESSSESVNAWTAVGLWAEATDNQALANQAAWLMSNEATAADSYWFGAAGYPAGYDKTVVGINWGGKREFGTWFSPEPNAAVGIQLIPMNPTMAWYGDRHGDRRSAVVSDAEDPNFEKQFADYLLMYQSMWTGSTEALDVARKMSNETIDDGNSRSYMYAWIMSQEK